MYNYLKEALKISFNRSSTQLASIVIIAFLGDKSTELLASFSLTLSAAAIFFIATSALQYGILSELSKSFGEKNTKDIFGVFFAGLWFIFAISSASLILAYSLPNPFSGIATQSISQESFTAYKTLLISLPVMAVSTAFQYLLEAHQKISTAFRIKIFTVSIQLAVASCVLFIKEDVKADDIALSYLATDIIGMIVSVAISLSIIDRKSFFKSAITSLNIKEQMPAYTRATMSGGPVLLGAVSQKYLFYYIGVHLASLGASSTSAFAILNSMIFIIMIPITGVAHLATIKISYAVGSNDVTLLNKTKKSIAGNFLFLSLLMGVVSWLTLPLFTSIFSHDTLVTSKVQNLGLFFMVFYFMNCLLSVFMGMLRGLSDTLYPQLCTNLALFSVMIPTLLLNPHIELKMVIMVFCSIGISVAIGLMIRWKKKLKTHTDSMMTRSEMGEAAQEAI